MSSIKNFLDKFIECAGFRKGISRSPDTRALLLDYREFDPYVEVSGVESLFNIMERLVVVMEVNGLYNNANIDSEDINKKLASLKEYLLKFQQDEKLRLDNEAEAIGFEVSVGFRVSINPIPSFYRGFTERVNNILDKLGEDDFALSALYYENKRRIDSVLNPGTYREVTVYSASGEFEELMTEMFVFGETLKNRLNLLSVSLKDAYLKAGGNETSLDGRVEKVRALINSEESKIASVDIMSYVLIITDFLIKFDTSLDEYINAKNDRLAIAYMFFINQVLIDSLESEYVQGFSRVLSIESENRFYLLYALMPIVMYYCLLNQRFNDLTEKTGGK